MKLTLISHALCPYVQRAVIALNEKDIAFERIDIDLGNKPAWFLALSPLGKTPVLKVGDQAIFESSVISEYLEDTTNPALHPQDPLARARHRGWIEFASTVLNQIWNFYTAKDDASYGDAAFAPVFRYFDVFDEVSGITFFANLPKLRAWRLALSQRPSVISAVRDDYPSLLRQFVIKQNSVLGQRFAIAA